MTHTKDHWNNEEKVIEHLSLCKIKKNGIGPCRKPKMLAHFRCIQKVLDLLDENNCVNVFVPPNLTHLALQNHS